MHRGLITGPRDLGVQGKDLDRLLGRKKQTLDPDKPVR